MNEVGVLIQVLRAAIRMSAPILFATLGEIYAESAGIINLGCEGMMLMGAFASFSFTALTGNYFIGFVIGTLAGSLLGLLMAFLCITLRTNQVVNGVALSLFSFGVSSYLFTSYFGAMARITLPTLNTLSIWPFCEIPVVGDILFQHHIMVYVAFILAILLGAILYRTSWGLAIRATGDNPRAADSLGINVFLVRYICVILAGALAGLGGATLILGEVGTFSYGFTAGRGWIAVILAIFSAWNPYKAIAASLAFEAVDALQLRLQLRGFPIPFQFLLMLPYLMAIILIVISSRKVAFKAPSALGKPYFREPKE
jgi:simple sugar transport system permease protein